MRRRRWVVSMAFVATAAAIGVTGADAAPVGLADVTGPEGLVQPLLGMYAHAAAFGDVNRDGWQDMFVGTFADYPDADYQVRGATGPATDRLLLGGPGGFTVDTTFPGTFGVTAGASFADLDNDGWPDLVVARYTLPDTIRGAATTIVLHNVGGHLTPGPALPPVHRARAAAALDYDGDGLLDLFLTDDWFFGGGSSELLHNRGGLQFDDVTAAAHLSGVEGFGASVADLSGDGWPDLVVAGTVVHAQASTPAARMFVNNRDGTFHEGPNGAFTWTTFASEDDPTGVAAGDLNRDGRPDLVIGQHFQSTLQRGTTAPIHAYLNQGPDANGDPVFQDITEAAGLPALATKSPDVQVADFDNDGWPDILTTASAANGTQPTVFRNLGPVDGVPRFEVPPGLGDPQYWVNAAVADVDHDGRLDVFVTDFDPGRPSLLFRGSTSGGHWLDVSVRGPGQGVGSRVEVFAGGGLGNPSALLGDEEVTTSSGYTTGLPPIAHFGLGPATSVDVRVTSARFGGTVSRTGVAVDGGIEVDAGAVGAPPLAGTPLVQSFTPSRLRQDYSGWVGMQVRVGPGPVTVSGVGRWVAAGNAGDHTVKLVQASSGADVPGGAAMVSTAGATAGTFDYARLAAPVTLQAGATYYLVSQETAGGDAWYDYDSRVTTTEAAGDVGAVYSGGATWVTGGTGGDSYGPPSLLYTTSAPPSSSTTSTTLTTTSTSTTSTTTSTSTSSTTTTSTQPPGAAATPLVLSFTPSPLRNDFSGWVGMQLGVGANDMTVSALGRWTVTGNAGAHRVKLVDAATGADVPGGSVIVSTAGGAGGTFRYTSLSAPVTLLARGSYYLVSEELAGGDLWNDYDTRVVTTAGAADTGVAYALSGSTGSWVTGGTAGQSYGPPGLLYATGSVTPPPTTTAPTSTTTTPPAVGGTGLVTSFTPTHLRRDFSGWVGMQVRVGATPIRVAGLGRWVVTGNSGSHALKLVEAQSGADVATVIVDTAGAAAGSFVYAPLSSPVTLRGGGLYYLVSQEAAGGDTWYDYDTAVVTTGAATVPGAAYAFPGSPPAWVVGGGPGQAFGPVGLLYE